MRASKIRKIKRAQTTTGERYDLTARAGISELASKRASVNLASARGRDPDISLNMSKVAQNFS